MRRLQNYILLMLSVLTSAKTLAQDVVLNEIMQSNVDGLMVKQDFPDSWIELYNNRSGALNLKGWRIGLTPAPEEAWTFSNSMTIYGHDYLLVYCDKVDNGYQHTDFHLDAGKCTIYLWDAEGTLIDSLAHRKQPAPNVAYGRTEDGVGDWNYEVTPTPGARNCGTFTDKRLPDPVFSLPGCVIEKGQVHQSEVSIGFPDETDLADDEVIPEDCRLYVTTDGSAPTTASASYGRGETCFIALDKTVVVRARLLSDHALAQLPVTHSYILHPRQTELPVFSLSTNDEYLYDEAIGMLLGTDYSGNCYKGWRRPFNLEYFEPNAKNAARMNQVCEAGMHGAGSLSHKQKAMNVYTNKRWQKKRFDCSTFWPDKPELTKTKTFCLRNGGSRCLDSRMEDAFAQKLFANHIDSLQYLEYRPCIVYINGVYRGVYGLRERANHTWAENNRGVAEDVVEEVEGFYTSDEAFAPVKALIDNPAATYEDYCRYMDMPLLIDYLCCQAFATNTLFPHSNVNMWKDPTSEDQRIHPLLKDLDDVAETANTTNWYNFITLQGEEGTWGDSSEDRKIFVSLFGLQEFRDTFIDRMQVYLGDFGKPEVTVPMVKAMRAEIDAEIAATFEAIDEGATYADFSNRIENLLIPYCQQRPMIHYQHLSERFELGKVFGLKVQNYQTGNNATAVRINGIALTEGDFDGAGFGERDVRLESGSVDYGWVRTITYQDGTVEQRVFEASNLSYRPQQGDVDRIQSVRFDLNYRPLASHDVTLTYTADGVECTNPYADDGVTITVDGCNVAVTSNRQEQITYVLDGKSDEASFCIKSDFPWRLELNGLTLSRTQGTIISSQGSAQGTIILNRGTENTLENKAQEADQKSPGAAVYSSGPLTIQGEGQLIIHTSGKVGRSIASERDLWIKDVVISIVNKSKGLKEYGAIYSGIGIYSGGNLQISTGQCTMQITGQSGKGIIAEGALTLGDKEAAEGPTIDIEVTGTTMYTASDTGTLTSGCPAIEAGGLVNVYGETQIKASAIDNASNGIKSYSGINIHGGQHSFRCYDDCLNSPGPIAFYGGTTVCFSTDDDAIDSDYPYPGAICLAGGNLFTYTLDVKTEEGLDCDDDKRIFISGGVVVSAGGAQDPSSRLVGGSSQGYYLGPGVADCDSAYYYSLVNAQGKVICTYRFAQSFANRLSLITAPDLGNGAFRIVYGTEKPTGYFEEVGNSFWLGGETHNTASYTLNTNNRYPTTMAIMGASISVMEESHVCKEYWATEVELDIRDYGIKGAGLCNTTQPGYGLQEEVDEVTVEGRPDYNVYLIWGPSNDFQKGGTIGTVTDYTESDGFDKSKLSTMCGGLNYVLRKIRQKDQDACVLMFTTMPIFSKGSDGYDPDATGSKSMHRYVDAQIEWCEHNSVPYLDLFILSGLTRSNHSKYMKSDEIHLNEAGYELIKPQTTQFLKDNIWSHQDIEEAFEDRCSTATMVYDLTGQRVARQQKGFAIVTYSDGRIEKILVK